jgi:hypothetical protein
LISYYIAAIAASNNKTGIECKKSAIINKNRLSYTKDGDLLRLLKHVTYMFVRYILYDDDLFLIQNSFPMREWHVKHMEKTVIKFVTGLSVNATVREKMQNKRYGRITNVCRQIGYDIKQGATIEQVLLLLQKIRNDSSFASLRKNDGSMERLNELDKHFVPSKEEKRYYWY